MSRLTEDCDSDSSPSQSPLAPSYSPLSYNSDDVPVSPALSASGPGPCVYLKPHDAAQEH